MRRRLRAVQVFMVLAVGILLAASTPGQAAAGSEDFTQAVTAYREQRYAEAAQRFAALAAGESDAQRAAVLHANAGTAAARAEQLGEAVWQLRTALALAPRDLAARTNLQTVRTLSAQSAASAAPASAMRERLLDVPLQLTEHESSLLAAALAGLAGLLLAGFTLGRLPAGARTAAVTLLLLAGGWYWLAQAAWERERGQAVVIAPLISARAEPETRGEILFRVPGGTVVRAEEQRGEWRLIESEGGERGWVPADEARPLRR
ncbi:MAG: SH3 domain-containing protein [Planctomycetota bacterium]